MEGAREKHMHLGGARRQPFPMYVLSCTVVGLAHLGFACVLVLITFSPGMKCHYVVGVLLF